MMFWQQLILSCLILAITWQHCGALQPSIPPVALITGATGRTGQLVSDLLLEQGFHLRIFCRDEAKARELFEAKNSKYSQQDGDDGEPCVIEYVLGNLNSMADVKAAFQTSPSSPPLTHLVFLAGGEGADYKSVNYYGVESVAKLAIQTPSIRQIVLVSTAWATRPYSIASLLFNTLYPETIPMASHYLGEQALRRAVASSNTNNPSSLGTDSINKINYVILRAGGLNSDDRWMNKYPEAAAMGLTFSQGDTFTFAGIAGRPGMCRSQLAKAVLAATTVEGGYTVEVTGSGPTDWKDSSVYQTTLQPDDEQLYSKESSSGALISVAEEEEVFGIHMEAVQQLKATAIAATAAGVGFIGTLGFVRGLISLLLLDAIILLLWGKIFATRQVSS
ncbi:unnamed protein product [Cylindrotheca closterium]|uniref:NAD(P)-binding domain-containing protein n=1 Tax=Cylindrotheca closterium TaxID=2856 RepID=A0AAD2CXI9_9STRA|nr:unnamed protein product [Cylindrotheca closterium]